MPAPISYTQLLATVQTGDLAMLTTFIVGVSVEAGIDAALADTLYTQAKRLYDMGLLTNLHRVYQDDGVGNLMQVFTALVAPQAAAYVAQLARERIALSRNPLP